MKFESYINEQSSWSDDIVSFIKKQKTSFKLDKKTDKEISLSTRKHGDMANDMPGLADIKAGRKLAQALTKKFGKIAKIYLDYIDEWVIIEIIKK